MASDGSASGIGPSDEMSLFKQRNLSGRGATRRLADPVDAADDPPTQNLGTHAAGPAPANERQRRRCRSAISSE
jgi:hypothetical protein